MNLSVSIDLRGLDVVELEYATHKLALTAIARVPNLGSINSFRFERLLRVATNGHKAAQLKHADQRFEERKRNFAFGGSVRPIGEWIFRLMGMIREDIP